MRITEGINYQTLLQDIARAQERVQTAQNQVSSGKKVTAPSDNPTAAADIVRLTGENSEAEQYSRNLTFAKSKLQVTDDVIDGVEKMVERVRTLGQLSFGNPTAASAYIAEVSGLRDQIISAANTMHAGRFLFAGSATTTAPYLKNPDSSVTYLGNAEGMSLQVTRSAALPTQLPGSEVFSGSVNIFTVMTDLTTAMQSGNKAGIDTQVRKLGQFADTVSVARSKVGSYLNLAANIESELSSAKLARETELSKEQAADLATAISELTLSQQGLQATLAVGARISQLNILDYLK